MQTEDRIRRCRDYIKKGYLESKSLNPPVDLASYRILCWVLGEDAENLDAIKTTKVLEEIRKS